MPIHTGRLLLAPVDPWAAPDPADLAALLHEIGLIGEPLPGRPWAYRVGAGFLDLVHFTGCAVRVQTDEASAGEGFSHIALAPPAAAPALHAGRNTRPPRCPRCRAPLRDWRERAPDWAGRREACVSCPACGASAPPWDWDWKEQGGFARALIRVEEVFPGEATPAARLMERLAALTGGAWRHFYVQDRASAETADALR